MVSLDLWSDLEVCTRLRIPVALTDLVAVAQRPPPGFPPDRNPAFGPAQGGNMFSNSEKYY
jgi:hypothetical protein